MSRTKSSLPVVCCDGTPAQHSRIRQLDVDDSVLDSMVLETIPQELSPHQERGLHNAAHHATHGPVTYLQHVARGGFFVYVGHPDHLEEHYFGPGSRVAFMDDIGPGHASRVGPDGVQRTMRILKGHLALPETD